MWPARYEGLSEERSLDNVYMNNGALFLWTIHNAKKNTFRMYRRAHQTQKQLAAIVMRWRWFIKHTSPRRNCVTKSTKCENAFKSLTFSPRFYLYCKSFIAQKYASRIWAKHIEYGKEMETNNVQSAHSNEKRGRHFCPSVLKLPILSNIFYMIWVAACVNFVWSICINLGSLNAFECAESCKMCLFTNTWCIRDTNWAIKMIFSNYLYDRGNIV